MAIDGSVGEASVEPARTAERRTGRERPGSDEPRAGRGRRSECAQLWAWVYLALFGDGEERNGHDADTRGADAAEVR